MRKQMRRNFKYFETNSEEKSIVSKRELVPSIVSKAVLSSSMTGEISKSNNRSRTENNSDDTCSSSSRSVLDSFLHDLIREKTHESGGRELHIKIRCDDAHGFEGKIWRQEYSRIRHSNSDPLSLKRSMMDVSDHSKRLSRWLSVQPSPSRNKEKCSTNMVRQPMRFPSTRRINAACSA